MFLMILFIILAVLCFFGAFAQPIIDWRKEVVGVVLGIVLLAGFAGSAMAAVHFIPKMTNQRFVQSVAQKTANYAQELRAPITAKQVRTTAEMATSFVETKSTLVISTKLQKTSSANYEFQLSIYRYVNVSCLIYSTPNARWSAVAGRCS